MTEAEWHACDDPTEMLAFLRDHHASERKLRLFAVACGRRVWHLLREKRSRKAVKLAERFADGEVDRSEMAAAHRAVHYSLKTNRPDEEWAVSHAQAAAREAAADDAGHAAIHAAQYGQAAAARLACAGAEDDPGVRRGRSPDARWRDTVTGSTAEQAERATQADLLRDIFGDPFKPATCDPSWRTSTVVSLARGVYEERAFDRMTLLMDALMDAGCDNIGVLDHCRMQNDHHRGCWVVDLVLEKT
jgi:hypothetical protein